MIAKKEISENKLFEVEPLLEAMVNHTHPLYVLANTINWESLEKQFSKMYSEGKGRPCKPIRLMVGLHYQPFQCDHI